LNTANPNPFTPKEVQVTLKDTESAIELYAAQIAELKSKREEAEKTVQDCNRKIQGLIAKLKGVAGNVSTRQERFNLPIVEMRGAVQERIYRSQGYVVMARKLGLGRYRVIHGKTAVGLTNEEYKRVKAASDQRYGRSS